MKVIEQEVLILLNPWRMGNMLLRLMIKANLTTW